MLVKAIIEDEGQKIHTHIEFKDSYISLEHEIKNLVQNQIIEKYQYLSYQDRFQLDIRDRTKVSIQFFDDFSNEWKSMNQFIDWVHRYYKMNQVIYCTFRTCSNKDLTTNPETIFSVNSPVSSEKILPQSLNESLSTNPSRFVNYNNPNIKIFNKEDKADKEDKEDSSNHLKEKFQTLLLGKQSKNFYDKNYINSPINNIHFHDREEIDSNFINSIDEQLNKSFKIKSKTQLNNQNMLSKDTSSNKSQNLIKEASSYNIDFLNPIPPKKSFQSTLNTLLEYTPKYSESILKIMNNDSSEEITTNLSKTNHSIRKSILEKSNIDTATIHYDNLKNMLDEHRKRKRNNRHSLQNTLLNIDIKSVLGKEKGGTLLEEAKKQYNYSLPMLGIPILGNTHQKNLNEFLENESIERNDSAFEKKQEKLYTSNHNYELDQLNTLNRLDNLEKNNYSFQSIQENSNNQDKYPATPDQNTDEFENIFLNKINNYKLNEDQDGESKWMKSKLESWANSRKNQLKSNYKVNTSIGGSNDLLLHSPLTSFTNKNIMKTQDKNLNIEQTILNDNLNPEQKIQNKYIMFEMPKSNYSKSNILLNSKNPHDISDILQVDENQDEQSLLFDSIDPFIQNSSKSNIDRNNKNDKSFEIELNDKNSHKNYVDRLKELSIQDISSILPEPKINPTLSIQPKFVTIPKKNLVKQVTKPLEKLFVEDETETAYKPIYKSYFDYYFDHHASSQATTYRYQDSKPILKKHNKYGEDYDTFSGIKKRKKQPWSSRSAFEEYSDDEDYINTAQVENENSDSEEHFEWRSFRPYSSIIEH